jgi:small conductance mechanosensitive channel
MDPSICAADAGSKPLCEAVYRATNNELLARLADTIVLRGGRVLLILVVTLVATRVMRRALRVLLWRAPVRTDQDGDAIATVRGRQRVETIGRLLVSMMTALAWAVASATILGEFGIDLGPLLAGAGILGVALGFGAQNLVRDFLSGIFMLLEDQYGVGDVIDAGPAVGTVEAVSLRTTRLRDVEGNLWHIPNGTIVRVANKSQDWARAVLDVPVAYGTDVDHATTVIKRVADALWRDRQPPPVLEAPEVWGVEQLGADGMTIRLVVKTPPLRQWDVARALRARLKEAFEDEGIEIPYPQRVVWQRGVSDPVRAPSSAAPASGGSRGNS